MGRLFSLTSDHPHRRGAGFQDSPMYSLDKEMAIERPSLLDE